MSEIRISKRELERRVLNELSVDNQVKGFKIALLSWIFAIGVICLLIFNGVRISHYKDKNEELNEIKFKYEEQCRKTKESLERRLKEYELTIEKLKIQNEINLNKALERTNKLHNIELEEQKRYISYLEKTLTSLKKKKAEEEKDFKDLLLEQIYENNLDKAYAEYFATRTQK